MPRHYAASTKAQCSPNPPSGCGVTAEGKAGTIHAAGLKRRFEAALCACGASVGKIERERLAEIMVARLRHRQMSRRLWSIRTLREEDVLRLILVARDTGDHDEALWRAFLAAHFGRESANQHVAGQVESAGRLLRAFTANPVWTWRTVQRDSGELHRWLIGNAEGLRQLTFGNHRKYESKQPAQLWEVIQSFLALVEEYGSGPSRLFATDPSWSAEQRHTELFGRLGGIRRFGRTAKFDFLSLVADAGLVDVAPACCYLAGSTGPLEGARRLWGRDRTPRELDRLAGELARRVNLSPLVLEDALCMWQKM